MLIPFISLRIALLTYADSYHPDADADGSRSMMIVYSLGDRKLINA